MEITEVKVFPVNEEKLKAFVSVVFDHCFMVNDIKVIQGKDGFFISMPSRRKKNGEFKDVAHPLNNETRRSIEARILAEYERARDRQQRPAAPAEPAGAMAAPTVATASASSVAPASAPSVAPVPTVAPASAPSVAAAAPPAPVAGALSAPGRPGAGLSAPGPTEPAAMAAPAGEKATSLDEVEEFHLRDSFWTVT